MINQSHKLSGPFIIDLKNRFRQIAGSDNKIDRKEFKDGLFIDNDQIKNRIFDIFDTFKGVSPITFYTVVFSSLTGCSWKMFVTNLDHFWI